MEAMSLGGQLLMLVVLALPIACVSWTVTHEDIFSEFREWLVGIAQASRFYVVRKLLYVFTCEYCFSHWVTIVFLAVFRFKLAYPGWRGYVIAGFSLVWMANMYMSLFGRLRLDIRHERLQIERTKEELEELVEEDTKE